MCKFFLDIPYKVSDLGVIPCREAAWAPAGAVIEQSF